MEMLNQKQKTILIIIIAIAVIVIGYYYLNSTKEIYNYSEVENIVEEDIENEVVKEEIEEEDEEIVVHVAGAVKRNGIVKVAPNSRIDDVIEAAGGITERADLSNVNLAYIVSDGQKIYIPSLDEGDTESKINTIITEGAGIAIVGENDGQDEDLVNINKASLTELITIPGIGEALGSRIIEYRTTVGSFKTIEDIKNVSGIGDAKFNTMKKYITV